MSVVTACRHGGPDETPTPFLETQSGSTFERMDRNGDGRLGLEAFHRGMSEHYYFRQGLDLDGDGVMQHVELTTAFFELWDVDDDRSLSSDEWRSGLRVWFPEEAAPSSTIREWDLDADGRLSVVELGEGALRSRMYDAYDGNHDGVVETHEVSAYLHARWDADGDGTVEAVEWPLD